MLLDEAGLCELPVEYLVMKTLDEIANISQQMKVFGFRLSSRSFIKRSVAMPNDDIVGIERLHRVNIALLNGGEELIGDCECLRSIQRSIDSSVVQTDRTYGDPCGREGSSAHSAARAAADCQDLARNIIRQRRGKPENRLRRLAN